MISLRLVYRGFAVLWPNRFEIILAGPQFESEWGWEKTKNYKGFRKIGLGRSAVFVFWGK